MQLNRAILFLAIWAGALASGFAADTFYVDPVNGSPDGDGSATGPWKSLQDVVDRGLIETQAFRPLPYRTTSTLTTIHAGAPIQAGDTILLRSGNHGALFVREGQNTDWITIAAAPGQTPVFETIRMSGVRKWRLRGLKLRCEGAQQLIFIETHGWVGPSSEVTIEDCDLASNDDTSGWSAADWNTSASSGIRISGTDCLVRNCKLRNVDFGISASADRITAEHNLIDSFSGDGLRGTADDIVFQHNVIKNCYDVNANHDDGIQFFRIVDGEAMPTRRAILRSNLIIESEDPDRPLRGHLQGIGCFDGMYIDWIVENNVVLVSHYHGITLGGAFNCRVVNNTAIDPTDEFPCWIRIGDHKDGTPSARCVVRNNISRHFSVSTGEGDNVVDHNLETDDPATVFRNYGGQDVRLKSGSPAIDAGSAELAPDRDYDGVPRPQGDGVDIGAYEYQRSASAGARTRMLH